MPTAVVVLMLLAATAVGAFGIWLARMHDRAKRARAYAALAGGAAVPIVLLIASIVYAAVE